MSLKDFTFEKKSALFLRILASFGICIALLLPVPLLADHYAGIQRKETQPIKYQEIKRLASFLKDSGYVANFEYSILLANFLITNEEFLESLKLGNRDTFMRVLSRYIRRHLAHERKQFIEEVASRLNLLYTADEIRGLHEFVLSPLGQKEIQVDKEIDEKILDLYWYFYSTDEIPQLPPFEFNEDSAKKASLLRLITLKEESDFLSFALQDSQIMDIDNFITVLLEHSLAIQKKRYTKEEIDSLIVFYSSPLGVKNINVNLNLRKNEEIRCVEDMYAEKISEAVSDYLESYLKK